jgi:type I restriction enzyme M protein
MPASLMHWIAPSKKDTDSGALEKRLWDTAEQAEPAPHLAKADYDSARPEGLLGIIFLRFAEVRFVAQRAKLKAEYDVPSQINHR